MWSECAAGGFVCFYIGIVWLCLVGIKCGVSVQQVALCVCVSALCGCEQRELNLE